MIVDANAYVGEWPFWPIPAIGEDGLLRTMDQNEVDMALVTSTKALLVDCVGGNADVAAMAGRHPDRLRPMAVVRAGAPDEAAQALDVTPAAFRLVPALHGDGGLGQLDDVLDIVAQAGLPLFLTGRIAINWGLPRYPVAGFSSVLERVGDLPVVLSGVNRVDITAARTLAKRGNVYLETSCLQEFDAMPRATQTFGADRLLLGTGMILQQASCGLVKVTQSDSLRDDDKTRILSGNAHRLFGIGG